MARSEVVWRETDRGTESSIVSLTDTSYTIDQLESTTMYTLTIRATRTVDPLLRDHLQIQRNLVSEKRWSSKGGFIVCTVSASVQGNSGL